MDREVGEAADRALAAELPAPESAYEFVYSPDVDPTSAAFATEPVFAEGAQPTTMVDLLNACLRDEMKRDPRIVLFGEDVADASRDEVLAECKGKGGVFKVTAQPAAPLRQGARLQLAAGRGEHRRPRDRHGGARPEAGRRDPVLRLHLARLHADPQRALEPALALGQRVRVRRSSCASRSAATSAAAPSTTRSRARC